MLAVAVDRHDALQLRQVFADIGKRVLERASFSLVHLVHQHAALRELTRLVEPFLMRLITAVVDNDDVFKARADQTLDDRSKAMIRIQRRQDDSHGF